MTKRVLALQHVWDDPAGYLGELLQEYALEYDLINVEKEPIPDPTTYDAMIVFGGFQHANDDHKYPYFSPEKALIRKAIEHEVPYLGICLGGQLLASVLGGSVQRHKMTEIGFFDIPLTEEGKADPLYAGLPDYQKVFHWHEDIFELPPDALLLASSESTKNQAFRYGPHAYGLQYHIELTPDMLNDWLYTPSLKQDMIDAVGIDAYTALEQDQSVHYALYRTHARIMFTNFLRIAGLI